LQEGAKITLRGSQDHTRTKGRQSAEAEGMERARF